jgi:hypothetical protein
VIFSSLAIKRAPLIYLGDKNSTHLKARDEIYFLSLFLSLRGGARALDAVPLMVSTESALSVTTDTERKRDNDNSPPDEKSEILVLPWCTKPPAPTKTRSLQLLSLGRRISRVSHPSHWRGDFIFRDGNLGANYLAGK